MNIQPSKTNFITFKARIDHWQYSENYARNLDYNGQLPDSFIISRLDSLSKDPNKLLVYDLGAGQGRNTIPIAKKGYNICAFEISPEGRFCTNKKAKRAKVDNKIRIYSDNLLDEWAVKKANKADFVFMSHISQHFKRRELRLLFRNVSRSLQNGGEFVMDALVRTKKDYKRYDKMPFILKLLGEKSMDGYGAASFNKKEIIKAAEKYGLKLVQETPFQEKRKHRNSYEIQNLWGGFKASDYLFGIRQKPVKLTWLVFKKCR